MPPRITEVQWGYSGRLPSGISFKEETGTFSGTPTKAGEYTIPVTVWTNYGEDTKDVKIVVTSPKKSYPVYNMTKSPTSGSNWFKYDSNSGLYVPLTTRLVSVPDGFGAVTEDGEVYFQGTYRFSETLFWGGRYTSDGVFCLGNNVMRILCGKTKGAYSNVKYFGFYVCYPNASVEYTDHDMLTDVIMHDEDLAYMDLSVADFRLLRTDKETVMYFYSPQNAQLNVEIRNIGYRAEKVFNPSSSIFTYLSEDKYLDNNPNNFQYGKIRNAWVRKSVAYVITEDNNLYEYNNISHDWILQGTYDVKKMEINVDGNVFMLTNDGYLYHKGEAAPTLGFYFKQEHSNFTCVYEGYYFHDITCSDLHGDYTTFQLTFLQELR